MKIVMIGPFGLRPKGTMLVRALPLARALVERGHTACLIVPPWSYPEDSGRTSTDAGVQVINIALPPRLPILSHFLITWRLVRAALAQQPDAVHCFKPKAYAGLAALLIWIGRLLRLTQVRLAVDSDDWEGRGGWNDIEKYGRVQKQFFAWQERWGLTHADAVTVASRTLQSLVWSLGVAPARTYYVPNGMPPLPPQTWGELEQRRKTPPRDVARPSQSAATGPANALTSALRTPPLEERAHSTATRPANALTSALQTPPPTVLLYTRFFEFKVERAVAIVAGILQRSPAVQVVVVGAGLFGEEKQFLAQIGAAGLAGRVTYAGWRDPGELPAYFAAADVAIYPFDDTLINRAKCAVKLIDLLSAGVPVVADRVGQNAEYIEHCVSGILVEPGDTAGFIAWVVRLLEDEGLRRSLGENARQRMKETYTWSRLAVTVEDAYR